MKKIISLVAALAVSMSAFVSLATVASAETAPRIVVSATEVDFTDAAYSAYAGGPCDWREYCDEDYTYKTYEVEVKLTGIELASEKYKPKKVFLYRGTSLITAMANFTIDTTGEKDDTWTTSTNGFTYNLIPGSTNVANETTLGSSGVSASAIYPAAGTETGVTVADTDEITIWRALVTVDVEVPLTLNLTRAGATIATYDEDMTKATPDSTVEYDTIKGNFPVTGVSLTLPVASAPTTYTYTFRKSDESLIETVGPLAAGAAVTAPTAPEVAGKVFDHWSDVANGDAVDVDDTASDNKTYYAVYVDAAPSYDKVDPDTTEQNAKVVDKDAGTYTDFSSGDNLTLTKNYAIARFNTDIIGAKTYKLHASSVSEAVEKDYPITSFAGIEVAGHANFVAIIKGAPKDTVMELRAYSE